jgi:preprotein translocase subunit Sec61beta
LEGTVGRSHRPTDPETFTGASLIAGFMSSGENSGGLMSSAGLVRYFDAEDRNAIRMDPKTVVAFGLLFGVLVMVLNALAV